MGNTVLPTDTYGYPIQALRFAENYAHKIAVAGASARNATAFQPATRVVLVYATGPCFVRVGGEAVVAVEAEHYVPAGAHLALAVHNHGGGRLTHIAAIRAAAGADCTLYVSELE